MFYEFECTLKKYEGYGDYCHLYYVRDIKKYGNLYSKFYFFETLLRDRILINDEENLATEEQKQKLEEFLKESKFNKAAGKKILNSLKPKKKTLYDLLNLAVKENVIEKNDAEILRKARNALFHFAKELELPILQQNYTIYEKILDKYIKKFAPSNVYYKKLSPVSYAPNIFKDKLKKFGLNVECAKNGVCSLENNLFFISEYKIHFLIKLLIDGGGSQDTQFKSIKNFLSSKSNGSKYVAVLDGEYFERKKNQLDKMADNQNSFIAYVATLESSIKADLVV